MISNYETPTRSAVKCSRRHRNGLGGGCRAKVFAGWKGGKLREGAPKDEEEEGEEQEENDSDVEIVSGSAHLAQPILPLPATSAGVFSQTRSADGKPSEIEPVEVLPQARTLSEFEELADAQDEADRLDGFVGEEVGEDEELVVTSAPPAAFPPSGQNTLKRRHSFLNDGDPGTSSSGEHVVREEKRPRLSPYPSIHSLPSPSRASPPPIFTLPPSSCSRFPTSPANEARPPVPPSPALLPLLPPSCLPSPEEALLLALVPSTTTSTSAALGTLFARAGISTAQDFTLLLCLEHPEALEKQER
ncbi:hypothetical protein JCM8547_004798 [Rhodosporidiobolus lusitaniae]